MPEGNAPLATEICRNQSAPPDFVKQSNAHIVGNSLNRSQPVEMARWSSADKPDVLDNAAGNRDPGTNRAWHPVLPQNPLREKTLRIEHKEEMLYSRARSIRISGRSAACKNGRLRAAGAAKAIGLVPSIALMPNVGTIADTAMLAMEIPMKADCAANKA